MKLQVWGTQGCGSVIVEAMLTLAKIPFEHIEVKYNDDTPETRKLREMNPLGQVPTVVLPNGTVLTESLAIAAYVHQEAPKIELIPPQKEDAQTFWRWVVFIVTAIYPTFTYGDTPRKWVDDENASKLLRESTDRWRKNLWLEVEREFVGPFFLGKKFSAIDLYLAVMVNWRPGKSWFIENCPKISEIADKISGDSRLRNLWVQNF